MVAIMRRLFVFSVLFISACSTVPQQPPPSTAPQPTPATPPIRSDLLGLTVSELIQRLGTPTLQIREGQSLKLQFRGRSCVLDAYLYPSLTGHGVDRVTHVDARLKSGADTNQANCIASLSGA